MSNISCADLNVISKECAYYQDKSTNIWRNYTWFYSCAREIRDEGPDYFHHPPSVCYAKTIHQILINCCIHVHPVCIRDKLSLDTKPVWSHRVFWANTLTQIDSSRCVWGDGVRLLSKSPLWLAVNTEAKQLRYYLSHFIAVFPASYLSQCDSVMETRALQQAIKRGRSLSVCRRIKTAHD